MSPHRHRGWTTTRAVLDRREVATTIAATAVSSGLYLRTGHPYLARGVVGDLAGFTVLGTVLLSRQVRVRHEALVCLAAIAAVGAAAPVWPLARPPRLWWSAMAAGLGSYLMLRRRVLHPGGRRPAVALAGPRTGATGTRGRDGTRRGGQPQRPPGRWCSNGRCRSWRTVQRVVRKRWRNGHPRPRV